MSEEELTVSKVQSLITRGPYHQWLGIEVVSVGADEIAIKAKWREEWVVNPDRGYTHGGILAALVDVAADWALVLDVAYDELLCGSTEDSSGLF